MFFLASVCFLFCSRSNWMRKSFRSIHKAYIVVRRQTKQNKTSKVTRISWAVFEGQDRICGIQDTVEGHCQFDGTECRFRNVRGCSTNIVNLYLLIGTLRMQIESLNDINQEEI
jgi:hypothetical protein